MSDREGDDEANDAPVMLRFAGSVGADSDQAAVLELESLFEPAVSLNTRLLSVSPRPPRT